MYAVTQDIIDLFNKHYRQVLRITFKRGNVTKVIDETEIRQGGFTIDRYSVSGSKVEVGSAIAAELTLKVKNYDGKYDETIFEGGELFVTKVFVDCGSTLKRMRPAPQGRGYRIRKRSNHVTLFVDAKSNNED